jgi:ATP-binding cassette, subfamily B, bacterial
MTQQDKGAFIEPQSSGEGVDFKIWRKLWRFAMVYRWSVSLIVLFALTTAFFDAALPWVTRDVVNILIDDQQTLDLRHYGLLYAALSAGLATSVFGFIRAGGKLRTSVGHDIRSAGFRNLQRLSFSYFDRRPVGWLMARMTSDCERLTNILAWGLLDIVWGVATMTGVTVAMMIVDWRLGLTLLIVVPLLAWISKSFQKRILNSSRAVRKTNSRITAAYNEGIMGVRTSKVFVREQANLEEFSQLTGTMNSVSMRNALQSAVYLPLVLVFSSLALALIMGVGGGRVVQLAIPLGTLVLFISYSRLFFDPIQELARLFAEMQMAQASAERVISLIEATPEIKDSDEVLRRIETYKKQALAPEGLAEDGGPDKIGTIAFASVDFGYKEGEQILRGFDLEVRAGETVALVGQTGGGKSTILGLLCRFYEPTCGEILIDGVDYRERSLHWLQSNLGIVLQEPQLFSGSITENIRYGDLSASEQAVRDAAELVGAHEFIDKMEEGYDSQVGEGGGRLSTGQKQLISFARAILKSPQLLVMDEATSSIDTETERRIQTALARVLKGRTSFVIAHRLSTIRNADRILVIEGGQIVECGSHSELIANRGRYNTLYTQQSLRSSVPEDEGGAWGTAPSCPAS